MLYALLLFLIYLFIRKRYYSRQTNEAISKFTGPISVKFSGLVGIRLWINDLKLVSRSFKGCCCGKQFFVGYIGIYQQNWVRS